MSHLDQPPLAACSQAASTHAAWDPGQPRALWSRRGPGALSGRQTGLLPLRSSNPRAGAALHPRTRGFHALRRRGDGRGRGGEAALRSLWSHQLPHAHEQEHTLTLPQQRALSDIFIFTSLTRSLKARSAAATDRKCPTTSAGGFQTEEIKKSPVSLSGQTPRALTGLLMSPCPWASPTVHAGGVSGFTSH